MSQHYPSNQISTPLWCNPCKGFTPHRIDGHRASYCLKCLEKIEQKHQQSVLDRQAQAELAARQGRLFA